ncbi:MAG: hypothetical protein LBQ35_05640 [Spirochaetaceae bacterium]|nr:hypothetical protein [Spirochaetaceae bacterium]
MSLIFFLRFPVLVVSDLWFDGYYGPRRVALEQALTAFNLFRPVRNVRIAEGAGEEVAVFTVESAAARPYCVIFPYRYQAAARRYFREHPAVPTGLLLGRRSPSGQDGPLALATDTGADLYRAGRAAGVLAGEGKVLFIYDDYPGGEERDAFRGGLRSGAYGGEPEYASSAFPLGSAAPLGAVVIRGPHEEAAQLDRTVPALLFSWMDPARCPRNIKVVFDDSPWTQAAEAARILAGERDIKKIPSVVRILNRNSIPKEQKELLKAALASFPPGE